MNEATFVCMLQGRGDLPQDSQCRVFIEMFVSDDRVVEGFTIHVFHHEIVMFSSLPHIVGLHDVLIVEFRAAAADQPPRFAVAFGEASLVKEAPGRNAGAEFRRADFDGRKVLADAALFSRDPKAFDQAVSRLTAARAELASSEEQWLELEMKREMLEG